jgi:hypothetical protein
VTAIIDESANDAQTHALVIGVGAYRHLEGGLTDRQLPDTYGMGQLTSPVVSAKEVASWLLQRRKDLARPLASVELVLSSDLSNIDRPTQYIEPSGKQHDVERATIDNILKACGRWKHRCNTHHGNIALLYCVGHGLETSDHFLLAEDFGATHEQPFDQSLNVSETVLNMVDCRAALHCFFIDACRKVPYDRVKKYKLHGRCPLSADVTTAIPHTLALWSTSHGYAAEGDTNDLTLFARAFLDCLDGLGSQKENGKWPIYTENLLAAMRTLMWCPPQKDQSGAAGSKQQAGDGRISGPGKGLIRVLDQAPTVPFVIECNPADANASATLSYQSLSDPRVTAEGASAPWEDKVVAGMYAFRARFAQGPYRGGIEHVFARPPITRDVVPVK